MSKARSVDAVAGPEAWMRLVDAYVRAPAGTEVEFAIGHVGASHVVLLRVGRGPRVVMSVEDARFLARRFLATETMPPMVRLLLADHIAVLARDLIKLADEAEARDRARLH